MDKICGIYKITSPTGKIYIGQSVDVERRKKVYSRGDCLAQNYLFRSIKKHGWENHKFEIIHRCEDEQLNEFEKYYVDLFQTFNSKHGMNLIDGGGSKGKASDETKRKMSVSHIGKGKGKTVSKETRKKISDSHKLIPTPIAGWNKGFKGVHKHTEETKERMSNNRKGVIFSDETLNKMSLAKKGKPSNNNQLGFKHSEETKAKMKTSRINYLTRIAV